MSYSPRLKLFNSPMPNGSMIVFNAEVFKKTGNKIKMIKAFRSITGMGLRDAKEFCEEIISSSPNSGYSCSNFYLNVDLGYRRKDPLLTLDFYELESIGIEISSNSNTGFYKNNIQTHKEDSKLESLIVEAAINAVESGRYSIAHKLNEILIIDFEHPE